MTYHRWRAQYGGLKADGAKRLKELEGENARWKRIVADKELQIEALKELGGELVSPARRRPAVATCSGCSGCCSGGRASWSGSTAAPNATSQSSPIGTEPSATSCGSSAGPILAALSPRPRRPGRAGLDGEPQGHPAAMA
jgi:putative transposase